MTARLAGCLLAICAVTATASVVPPPGRVDPRVREVDYVADQVVSLPAYVGYHIDLELEAGEQLIAVGAGDAAAVDVAAEGSHVLLKPKSPRVDTNLTLVSSRRVYHFEYRSHEASPPFGLAIFALRFRYPVAPSKGSSVATPLPFSSTTPVLEPKTVPEPATPVSRPVNLDYRFCGSPWLQPIAASDDGVQTRLTFAARGEWPAIFVANADESESLVNFHAEGTTAVVHRVAERFVLRRGRLVGCVQNGGYAGSGAYVSNGALDPATTREVKP